MSKDLETTYYRFMSEVRAFLSKLLKNPVDAQPSKYLKDRDFTRKKLIDELLKRDVIERHEKILDRTNSDEKEAKYVVKFKVHKKDFEKRIHRIYIKFFEKYVNESVEEMQVYHGSPLRFKKFNEKYISTCYMGWGTYVSTDLKCGKQYARGDGYIYEVTIPEDNGQNYINGDEVTNEEAKKVYSIMINGFPNNSMEISNAIERSKENGNFSPFFNEMGVEGIPASAKEISKLFSENGIVGVKWDTTYLIFDAKNIKIVNRINAKDMTMESVFANEDDMKKKILNGPDGDTYRKRGGIREEAAGDGAGVGEAPAGEAPAGSHGADTDEKADGGRGQFNTPVFPMQRRTIYAGTQGDIKTKNPILGKTITAESKKSRRIFVTEEQLKRILEEEGLGGATTTTSVPDTSDGMLGTIKPGKQFQGPNGKSNDDFMKPAMEREPGFSVERIGEKK